MKKKLSIFLALSGLLAGCTVNSIDGTSIPTDVVSTGSKQTEAERIYKLYVDDGGTLTFDEWFATIKGEPGKDGTSFRSGNGAPASTLGIDGDSYVDLETWDYYIKATGSWIKSGNLKGEKGDAGISILSITKTDSDGLLDTYTITYSDGSTSTFVVANGAQGERGIQGLPGQDGHTPVISIGENGNWFVDGVDTGIKAQGPKGDKGDDGVSVVSIVKTSQSGLADIYTITYSDGHTSTFVVTNGAQGIQGVPGRDGHSPVVTIGENGNWFVDGVDTGIHAQGIQGEKGDKGDKGDAGVSIISITKTGSDGLVDTYTIVYSDGTMSTFKVVNGEKGDKGDTGPQGPKGETGENGSDGKSAYEIYKEAHPEYQGDEQQWLDDLVNGRLGTKEAVYFTVTFDLDYDGLSFTQQVLDGKKARKPEIPVRNGYEFVDWVDAYGDHWVFNGYPITENITLYAVWSDPIEYTVTFVNNGGTVLGIETGHYGDMAVYHGDTPVAENQDAHYIYTFSGWDKDLVITGDATITAQYISNYVTTTAYYYDYDGETLLATVPLAEGDIPVYPGAEPTRETDEVAQLMFEFAGWEKTEETVDKVVFTAAYRSCTLQLEIQDNTVVVYRGTSENVVIPEQWNGTTITKIDSAAFKKTKITSIDIPSTVTSIGDNAFCDCTGLKTVKLPEGLRSLSEGMFSGCTNLQEIAIPSGVTYSGYSSAFVNCSSLQSIILPEGFTSVSRYMFEGCTSLQEIYLPSTLRSIGMGAFIGCTALRSIFIPKGVTNIEVWAFGDCSGLTIFLESEYVGKDWHDNWNSSSRPVVFGATREGTLAKYSETSHCYYCVSNREGVQTAIYLRPEAELEDINIPSVIDGYPVSSIFLNTMQDVKYSAKTIVTPDNIKIEAIDCRELYLLEKVVFGKNSISALPSNAFSGCASLKNVRLPSSLTSIGGYAFYNCPLELIYLPSSITSIEQGTFFECRKLRHVLYGSSSIPNFYNIFDSTYETSVGVSEAAAEFFDYQDDQFAYHLFPNVGEAWIRSFHGESGEGIVPDSIFVEGKEYKIVRIVPLAFYESKIKSIDMSHANSLTAIGQSAFSGCLSLSNVVLPKNITTIPTLMFEGCWDIRSIVLPKSLIYISYRSFNGPRLETVFSERTSEDDGTPISIGDLNDSIKSATWYYYSEEKPTSEGNYWHYVDGVPTIWVTD